MKTARLLLVFVAFTTLSNEAPVEGNHSNPGVIPPNASFRGLTYGEWAAKWWQAVFALPVVNGVHPVISGGVFGLDEKVAFLAAVVGSQVKVEITIPAGTPLFFPVVNAECSIIEPPPFHGDDEASLRACANSFVDNWFGLFANIDGKPVRNLDAYRVESPLFEFGPVPDSNLLAFFGVDAPAGATSESVDAGVYLLLAPLSVGKHVVQVGGTDGSLFIDTTFVITVVPRRQ